MSTHNTIGAVQVSHQGIDEQVTTNREGHHHRED